MRSHSEVKLKMRRLRRLRKRSARLYQAMLEDKSYKAALAWQKSLRRVREVFDEIKPVIVT